MTSTIGSVSQKRRTTPQRKGNRAARPWLRSFKDESICTTPQRKGNRAARPIGVTFPIPFILFIVAQCSFPKFVLFRKKASPSDKRKVIGSVSQKAPHHTTAQRQPRCKTHRPGVSPSHSSYLSWPNARSQNSFCSAKRHRLPITNWLCSAKTYRCTKNTAVSASKLGINETCRFPAKKIPRSTVQPSFAANASKSCTVKK